MSDFLTRMAQRSLGAAPLIAPRLPGLFAPVEESSPSNVANAIAATEEAPVSTLASLPLQSRTKGSADPASNEPRANIDTPQHFHAPEAAIAPAPAAHTGNTQSRIEATLIPLVDTAQTNTQTTAPLVAPVAPVASDADASLKPSKALRDMPATAPEQWSPLLPQRNAEHVAPFAALADTPVGAETGTPPAPTVHITIGRVEVRANIATPPAAPRPRAVSKPAQSLGDYLKHGAGAS